LLLETRQRRERCRHARLPTDITSHAAECAAQRLIAMLYRLMIATTRRRHGFDATSRHRRRATIVPCAGSANHLMLPPKIQRIFISL